MKGNTKGFLTLAGVLTAALITVVAISSQSGRFEPVQPLDTGVLAASPAVSPPAAGDVTVSPSAVPQEALPGGESETVQKAGTGETEIPNQPEASSQTVPGVAQSEDVLPQSGETAKAPPSQDETLPGTNAPPETGGAPSGNGAAEQSGGETGELPPVPAQQPGDSGGELPENTTGESPGGGNAETPPPGGLDGVLQESGESEAQSAPGETAKQEEDTVPSQNDTAPTGGNIVPPAQFWPQPRPVEPPSEQAQGAETEVATLETAEPLEMTLSIRYEKSLESFMKLMDYFKLSCGDINDNEFTISGIPPHGYPDYYGGAYINGSDKLTVELVEDTAEIRQKIIEITGDEDIVFTKADFPYSHLAETMSEINSYIENGRDDGFTIGSMEIDDFGNRIIVDISDVSESVLSLFRDTVTASEAILFICTTSNSIE